MIDPTSPVSSVPGSAGADDPVRQRLEKAAESFEAHFIKTMLRQMREATKALADEDSPLRNRVNDDMMDMADRTVADTMASQRAFGIADTLVRQLLPRIDTPAESRPAEVKPGAAPVALTSKQSF